MVDNHVPAEQIRVTDGERQSMVEDLGRGLALGCLTTEEFEHRATVAWAATTRGELEALAADMPNPMPALPIERRSWSRRALPVVRGFSILWTIVALCSVMLEGLVAVSGAPGIAAAWWIFLVAGGLALVPLSLVTSDKHDSPGTP